METARDYVAVGAALLVLGGGVAGFGTFAGALAIGGSLSVVGILLAGVGVVAWGVEIGSRPMLERLTDISAALDELRPGDTGRRSTASERSTASGADGDL